MDTETLDAQSAILPGGQKRSKLAARLVAVTRLAEGISSFEFVAADGDALPPFTAGSHIDVYLPNGVIRQYSLCNDASERHRYVVAVLRDELGRGGSRAMHEALSIGATVTISAPRNHFELAHGATRHLFIAGGIGITPIMSMIAQAKADGSPFHLFYCARSPERTAFLAPLGPLIERGLVTVHYDGGQRSNSLDFDAVLRDYVPGTHVYYCGPSGLLDAVEAASAHWPTEARHCERFSAAPPALAGTNEVAAPIETAFDIELARSHQRFTVAPGESIVDVLRAHGIAIDTSCQEGYCGTCMTRYLGGEPLHRDTVLDEEDREEFLMICCSRARSKSLVLDL